VTEVDEVHGGTGFRRRVETAGALVRLLDDVFVEDASLLDHEQAQVLHDQIRENAVVDVLTVDVQAEVLTLDAAAIPESNLEVELYSFLDTHGILLQFRLHRRPQFQEFQRGG